MCVFTPNLLRKYFLFLLRMRTHLPIMKSYSNNEIIYKKTLYKLEILLLDRSTETKPTKHIKRKSKIEKDNTY